MTKITLPKLNLRVREPQGLNGWQTMANAPKDEWVDLIDTGGDRYMKCFFSQGLWVTYYDSGYYTIIYKPVYWMKVKMPYDY